MSCLRDYLGLFLFDLAIGGVLLPTCETQWTLLCLHKQERPFAIRNNRITLQVKSGIVDQNHRKLIKFEAQDSGAMMNVMGFTKVLGIAVVGHGEQEIH